MVLWGLLALPVIWWLLRLTPPKPQTEIFPPLPILARVLKREETPQQSPWWLTLLRLLLAALVIAALADPIWNPRERLPTDGRSEERRVGKECRVRRSSPLSENTKDHPVVISQHNIQIYT